MSENCIFCKIIAGNAPADMLYQDDQMVAFRDQRPSAPVHILIVPNRHIPSLNQISDDDGALLGRMMVLAQKLAEQQKISQKGYRVIINTGAQAGQTVFHLHLHLLGGQAQPALTA